MTIWYLAAMQFAKFYKADVQKPRRVLGAGVEDHR